MRIAQLSSMTGWYGGEVHLATLAAGLRDRGHDVWAVVRPGSALAARLADRGVAVRTLPLVDWYEPLGTLRLRAWLRRTGIEILHTHTPRDWYTAAVATLGTGTVNVGTRHRLDPIGDAWLKRPFLGRFAALLAVSGAVRASLLAGRFLPPDRVLTVRHGVDLPAGPVDRPDLRRRMGVAADAPLVGFVGRLSPEKGLPVLLEAAARLRGRVPGLRVVVIGDEEPGCGHGRVLRAQAADLAGTVSFLGYRSDAAELCGGFDVLALTSAAEPFGLVLLEAMGRGVPVAATRAGGVPEIVRDGRDGLLLPPGDAGALAGALARLLQDRALRTRLGAQAAERVRTAFAPGRMVSLTEAVYRGALPAPAGRFSPASPARPASRRR